MVLNPGSSSEVRLRHSSNEADEQSRATGGGAGGAKAGDQGERGTAKHTPDTGPGTCDPGAGPRTASRKAEEEGTVHRAPPPYQCRYAPDGVLRAKAQSRPRRGWYDVAGLRGGSRTQDRGSAWTGPPRSLSAATIPPGLHRQGGWKTTAASDRRARGQDRPGR